MRPFFFVGTGLFLCFNRSAGTRAAFVEKFPAAHPPQQLQHPAPHQQLQHRPPATTAATMAA